MRKTWRAHQSTALTCLYNSPTSFGINVSHKFLEVRIVNHKVLQAHGMPCEPFIQICWTGQALSMYYQRSQIKSFAVRVVCFNKSSTNTAQMAERPEQQSRSNELIANCNKLPASCQVRPANHCNHAAAPRSNKSHTDQTWCVRVFLQTHMAICTHMTTYEKIENWHGTANSSWTMLLMHKQSNVQQMITDCDLTRGLEHWVSLFAPRDAAKQQLLWLTFPSKQTKLSQCVKPKTLSSIIPWATRST